MRDITEDIYDEQNGQLVDVRELIDEYLELVSLFISCREVRELVLESIVTAQDNQHHENLLWGAVPHFGDISTPAPPPTSALLKLWRTDPDHLASL